MYCMSGWHEEDINNEINDNLIKKDLYAQMHYFRWNRFIRHRRSVPLVYRLNKSGIPRKTSYAAGIKESL